MDSRGNSADIVRAFGYLTLGSRLKRLGERLQADVERLARTEGFDVPHGLFPILAALDRCGPMRVTDLVAALGVSQPGVSRSVAQLKSRGLVRFSRSARDQRERTVSLSAKGQVLVDRTKGDLWQRVERAVAAICSPLDGPLLEQLTAIEDALAANPLDVRAGAVATAEPTS